MKKTVKIIISVIALAVLGVAAFLLIEMKKYSDECPVITVKNNFMAEVGETVSINDLVEVTNAVEYRMLPHIIAESETDAKVLNGGQELFVGYYNTTFSVVVLAKGKNAETRSETVQIGVFVE